MPRQLTFLAVAIAALAVRVSAQPFQPEYNPVFDDRGIPSIYIDIDPASLDSIMTHVHRDDEYPASFIFDNGTVRDTVENIGFRLRGATSRTPPKKSFKVSFNTFERGRKFHGLEKLNINSEHNDPSIVRTKLSWDLFGELAVPATRANHVLLYVNGAYYGLYMNVEHIDEQFLKSRFGNDAGNLYKCLYPADLTYRGPDASAYRPRDAGRRPYDLTQGASDEEGYGDLAQFIDILNNTPDEQFREAIEAIFDVNGYLRTMAADVVTGNWDNYWYLSNNFYLYNNPETGLFHFIPYDLDNTFGVDFVQEDWGRREVYSWGHRHEARPLAKRILSIPEYRDRYTFYIRWLLEAPARPVPLSKRAADLRDAIRPAAESDPYHRLQWGWGSRDFMRSYTEAIGGHVKYGLFPFIAERANTALGQLDAVDIVPILSGLRATPSRPAAGDPIHFRVLVEDEASPASVELHFRTSDGALQTMSLAPDPSTPGYFAITVPPFGDFTRLTYHVTATDASGQTGRTAPAELEIGHAGPPLFVNELMASSGTTIADEFGEFDDWIELYNAGEVTVSIAGYGLTDNFDAPFKWVLPDTTIPAGGFLLVWADGQPEQGPLHAPFRLGGEGEQVGLYDPNGAPVSTFSFGPQARDVSYGRDPDGSSNLGPLARATPGASNNGTAVGLEVPAPAPGLSIRAYPNPFADILTVEVDLAHSGSISIDLFDVTGRRLRRLAEGTYPAGRLSITLDDASGRLAPGVYLLRAVAAGSTISLPVVRAR